MFPKSEIIGDNSYILSTNKLELKYFSPKLAD